MRSNTKVLITGRLVTFHDRRLRTTWADVSVGKVLAIQAGGPELHPHNPCFKKAAMYMVAGPHL